MHSFDMNPKILIEKVGLEIVETLFYGTMPNIFRYLHVELFRRDLLTSVTDR